MLALSGAGAGAVIGATSWFLWGHREKGSSQYFVAGTSFLAPSTASPFLKFSSAFSSPSQSLSSSLRPHSLSKSPKLFAAPVYSDQALTLYPLLFFRACVVSCLVLGGSSAYIPEICELFLEEPRAVWALAVH